MSYCLLERSELSVSQYPEARRPKLIWFNGALTLVLMASLIAGLLPLPVLFMIAFSIAMIVNYPCLQAQKDRIAAHAGRNSACVYRGSARAFAQPVGAFNLFVGGAGRHRIW